MNALFVLAVFGMFVWGIGWVLWKLLKMPVAPPVDPNAEPPDPGPFNDRKYRTPQAHARLLDRLFENTSSGLAPNRRSPFRHPYPGRSSGSGRCK